VSDELGSNDPTVHPNIDPRPPTPEKLGRYEIVRELGKGAMGVVYEGLDPNIGRRVAIKTARREVMAASGRADEMMERFLREARAAGNLSHPNIITIFDADREGDTAYFAMEYVQGTDLQQVIRENRRFSPEEAAEVAATVCDALGHAHEAGIVHRDIKPANIMRLPDGTLRVTDFGIARVADSDLTQDGALVGTPHYMSPEQFQGQRVDGRSDLFSVGIILYELLTGEKPFTGEALGTVMHNVTQQEPIQPKTLNVTVNPTLNSVVLKALSKDPFQRYQDARAMAAALRESVKPEPNPAITQTGAAPAADASLANPDDVTVALQRPPAGVEEAPASETASDPSLADAPTVIGETHVQGMNVSTEGMAPETKAGEAIARPGETVAGDRPRDVPDVGTLTPKADVPPGRKDIGRTSPARKPMLYAAAALGFLLLAGLVYAVVGRGGGEPAYSVAPGQPYYEDVYISAFLAESEEQATQYRMESNPDWNQLVPAQATVIATFADGTRVELGTLRGDKDGQVLEFEGRPADVTLEIRQEGYESSEQSPLPPSEEGETWDLGIKSEPIILVPK